TCRHPARTEVTSEIMHKLLDLHRVRTRDAAQQWHTVTLVATFPGHRLDGSRAGVFQQHAMFMTKGIAWRREDSTSDPPVPNQENSKSKCLIWCRLGARNHSFSASVVPTLYGRQNPYSCWLLIPTLLVLSTPGDS